MWHQNVRASRVPTRYMGLARRRQSFGDSDLIRSIHADNTELALALIASGVDVNDAHNRYALHLACEKHNLEIVEALIEANANLNVTHEGRTPLALACSSGPSDVQFMLLAHGCNYEFFGFTVVPWGKVRQAIASLDEVRIFFSGRKWPKPLIEELLEFILHEENMKRVLSA